MDTLILLQDDKQHTDTVKEGNIQNPDGVTQIEPISKKLQLFDYAATAALGDATASLGMAYFNHIAGKVRKFADMTMQKELRKPASQRHDNAEFQIIVEFHQTSSDLARAISKAFLSLRDNDDFKKLADKNHIAVRVHRVFIVSCESGGNHAPNAKQVPRYAAQAKNMVNAIANGCRTSKEYPPSKPPEYWYPDLYTFSTGDIVTGSLTLNPNHLQFKSTPDWRVENGNIIGPADGTDGKIVDSGGTIYRTDFNSTPGSSIVTTTPIPAGAEFDLLKSRLP